MCGIVGLWGLSKLPTGIDGAMLQPILVRGPDGNGVFRDDAENVFFGHARLSILDLTKNSAQPVFCGQASNLLVFNGEIYNYRDLTPQGALIGSDTLSLKYLVSDSGIDVALEKLSGMFAIAYFDRVKRKLYLARDRYGEKPLYYWISRDLDYFGFSSDLRSFTLGLSSLGERKPTFQLARTALNEFFNYNYIGGDRTVFADVKKLRPGEILTVEINGSGFRVSSRRLTPVKIRRRRQSELLDSVLDEVIRDFLVADVPVGCFLSGGIDSTVIVTAAARIAKSTIKTFSVGWEDPRFDESATAERTAEALKTDHTSVRITGDQLLEFAEQMHKIFPEPFSDSSQIPAYFVCKSASKNVKVVLTGDGGDEVFGGYNRYYYPVYSYLRFLRTFARVTGSSRFIYKSLVHAGLFVDQLGVLARVAPVGDLISKAEKIVAFLTATDQSDFYNAVTRRNLRKADYLSAVIDRSWTRRDVALDASVSWDWRRMREADIAGYLPDDNLQKIDRLSMFNGLEARVPFLDPRLIQWADSRASVDLLAARGTKLPLRDYLDRHLPGYRPGRIKSGFASPMRSFVLPTLKDWIFGQLNVGSQRSRTVIDRELFKKYLVDFYRYGIGDPLLIWDAVVFINFENQSDLADLGEVSDDHQPVEIIR